MNKTKKKPTRKVSPSKKQSDLLNGSVKSFGQPSNIQPSNIVSIFLVRQGLRGRTEQIVALADNESTAIEFCRTTLMPKYCNENTKNSLRTLGKDGESLNVNKSNDQLLIKRIDFVRTEEGRTNANPLWYWNIAKMTIINKHSFNKK